MRIAKRTNYNAGIMLLMLLIQVTTAMATHHRQQHTNSIHHLFFIGDHKIFYVQQSFRKFGFINQHNGEVMTSYQLESYQNILEIDKHHHQLVLRKNHNQFLIFKMKTLEIVQKHVALLSNYNQIKDVIEINSGFFVLTDFDLRFYQADSKEMREDNDYILFKNSKKGKASSEYQYIFHKILPFGIGSESSVSSEEEKNIEVILVYSKKVEPHKICFKKMKKNRSILADACSVLGNPVGQISHIQKSGDFIILETEASRSKNYYVHHQHLNQLDIFYGKIMQTDKGKAILEEHFKTFLLNQKTFIQKKLILTGLTAQHQSFSIKCSQKNIVIFYGDSVFAKFQRQNGQREGKLFRSWIKKNENNTMAYSLVIQFQQEILAFYEIIFVEGKDPKKDIGEMKNIWTISLDIKSSRKTANEEL